MDTGGGSFLDDLLSHGRTAGDGPKDHLRGRGTRTNQLLKLLAFKAGHTAERESTHCHGIARSHEHGHLSRNFAMASTPQHTTLPENVLCDFEFSFEYDEEAGFFPLADKPLTCIEVNIGGPLSESAPFGLVYIGKERNSL